MTDLASSTMSNDPDYTRQVITIRKSVYQALRDKAQGTGTSRMKIGDVIELLFDMADPEALDAKLEEAKQKIGKGTKRNIAGALKDLKPEQREAILKQIEQMKAQQ